MCRHFPLCGGCQTLDLPYAEQLRAKQAELARHFTDWPGLVIDPILPSPRVDGYRHKVQLPFGVEREGKILRATLGCYAAGSHHVVDQEECRVQDPGLSRVAWAVRDWATDHAIPIYDETTGMGWLRHLLLRKGSGTGEIILGLVTNGATEGATKSGAGDLLSDLLNRCELALGKGPQALGRLVGVVQVVNADRTNVVLGGEERLWWGRPYLNERLGPFEFQVGVSTFFQVNPFQTPRLYDLAVAAVPEGSTVLDLYSGIGSIALWASRRAQAVLAIEENPLSVASAARSAAANGITNVTFLASDVGHALAFPGQPPRGFRGRLNAPPGSIPDLSDPSPPSRVQPEGVSAGVELSRCDVAIVDPPRKGLEAEVRAALCDLGLKRIIYVSCFPATLARDVRALADRPLAGRPLPGRFALTRLSPVDMFPNTRHVECVAVLDAL